MTFGRASAGRLSRLFGRPRPEGGAVACAAAMPLVVLALAVVVDYASVWRFRTRVQLAADAASLAAAEVIARQPDRAGGSGGSDLAGQITAATFVRHAPRGAAGTPTLCREEPPRRGHGDRRLRGRGAEQFRLCARL